MNRILTLALLCSIALFDPTDRFITAAQAQSSIKPSIIPLSEPDIGTLPSKPSGAQSAHDQASIEQLMKAVELSRVIGGGITQMLGAIIGTKAVPLHNDPSEKAARDGGAGLKAMVDSFMAGKFDGPEGIKNSANDFQKAYSLGGGASGPNGEVPQAAAQAIVSAAVAEEGYKRSNLSMNRLDDYLKTLEASQDLKTSIDLNTRVVLELTQQVNETARLQATTASLLSVFLIKLSGGSAGNYKGIKEIIEKYR
ncbi:MULTISPECIES: type IV secretion system protein [unclassified Neorhizobium]|uniref:type IV secretion system protein n=1 Tax=unclassified Neorhizobium TaxID=2629175 RepID=UPI001FF407BC|nr:MULTISPECIES: type IV secretion system protein [unclassified Neorhizobium]MCJ9670395.1 type IV secretion system protein [Neorhizobium sp. SHOUNA12B]MCJ9746292.1 type IV secretion system protein [Neorhizobium sp. SHOUNA12A]